MHPATTGKLSWLRLARRRTEVASQAGRVLPRYADAGLSTRVRRTLLITLGAVSFFYGFLFSVGGSFVLMPLLVPLALLAVIAIWLLPDTDRAPLRLLDRLMFLFLIAVICWPNYLALALPGMPWVTAIRLTVVPLALVFAISLSISSSLRRKLKDILGAAPPIWKLLAAFVAIGFFSVVISKNLGNSLNKFVVAQLYWTLIFFIGSYVFAVPGNAYRLARLLWIAAIFVCVIAVWEWRLQRLPWDGHIPSFLKVSDEVVERVLTGSARSANGFYRSKSVFTTPLGLGEYLGLVMPFILYFMLVSSRYLVKALGAVSCALIFWVLLLADTRLGMVGFFLSFLLTLFAWGVLKSRQEPGNLVARGIVLLYPLLFVTFIAATFFLRRLEVLIWGGGAQQASTDTRKTQIGMGWPKIFEQPWGYGAGQSGDALGFFGSGGVMTVDTYYLTVVLEYGVLGFLIYYAMFLYAAYAGGRKIKYFRMGEVELLIPICIALLNFVVIKAVFSQESNHPIVFALLGAVVALVYRAKDAQSRVPGRV